MMRLQTYAALSVCATVAIIYHAFHSRGQFYPAMVYLSTSKISLVLLLNMGLVIKCSLWQLTKKVFLGSLREAEVERLNEQSWREVMEVLFAITIFRQDFSVSFLAMVTTLLLIKALHWLAQKRVEYIETTPTVPTLSHVRIVSFMAFLLVIDSLFLYSSVKYLIETKQASVSLFFSFEYMILATTTVATFVKYLFYVRDMILEGQWEKKAVYTFYLELIRDLLHLSMYLCFFMVIFVNYGVPLHLIRELYETFRNFKIRVADYIRYRKITSNMNDRFPDATSEELSGSDATCIICREEMTTAKKLLCGHLFHVQCLRSWLERQHTCPTCRALVVPPENGSTTVMGPHGPLPHSHQPASTGTSAQSSTANQSADVNLSRSEARLLAATRAASMYEKSFVYPSGNKLVWSTGYSLLRHGQFSDNINKDLDGEQGSTQLTGPLLGGQAGLTISVSPPQFPQSAFPPFQVIGATMSSGVASSHEMTDSELEGQTKFLEHQIEILKNQLQSLQKPKRNNNAPVDTQLISSDEKGKGIATDADCGHHGEIKRSSS